MKKAGKTLLGIVIGAVALVGFFYLAVLITGWF